MTLGLVRSGAAVPRWMARSSAMSSAHSGGPPAASTSARTRVRFVEHQAHAPGDAALLIEERGVLVAGDMLSDVLIPMLDVNDTADRWLPPRRAAGCSRAAGGVDVLVPGHVDRRS